ncbi:hypothetical protein [Streptomyces clavifer]|uniref:hypothetical protein n=1 Tax=Streptomyces clavifer TaxID=68188 RepID=UPI0033F4CA0F
MTRTGRRSSSNLRKRNHLRSATLLLAACTLTAAAGCSSEPDTDKKPAKSAPAAPTSEPSKPADPSETAETEVLDTYAKFWNEMERSYAQASTAGTDIKLYAAGVKLVRVQEETSDMKKDGQRLIGSVTVGDPTVSDLDIERKVPSATLTSCLDVSRWDVVDAETKKKLPLPSDRLTKYVNVSTLERWPDGWKVIEDDPQVGKSC